MDAYSHTCRTPVSTLFRVASMKQACGTGPWAATRSLAEFWFRLLRTHWKPIPGHIAQAKLSLGEGSPSMSCDRPLNHSRFADNSLSACAKLFDCETSIELLYPLVDDESLHTCFLRLFPRHASSCSQMLASEFLFFRARPP